nr:MAG TPA: KE1 three helix bundle, DE.1A [Caudoviricetes sp.]
MSHTGCGVYKCLETSRLLVFTPAAVKVQFLMLVFGCIMQLM